MTGIVGALTVIVAVIAGFITSEPVAFVTVLGVGYVFTENRTPVR